MYPTGSPCSSLFVTPLPPSQGWVKFCQPGHRNLRSSEGGWENWGWGELGWVISQQRWSDGRAGNVRYWWLQLPATPLPSLPPDRLSTLLPYLQPPCIPSPWPGFPFQKGGRGLMAKRLPRERERGEGLRSHPPPIIASLKIVAIHKDSFTRF